jgi:hypothetical protein
VAVSIYQYYFGHTLLCRLFEPGEHDQHSDLAVTGRGSNPARGKQFISSPKRPNRAWYPLSLLFNVYRWLFTPEVNRLWHDVDHTPPSGAEVKNKR